MSSSARTRTENLGEERRNAIIDSLRPSQEPDINSENCLEFKIILYLLQCHQAVKDLRDLGKAMKIRAKTAETYIS